MLQYENSRFISYFDLMKLKLNFCPLCEAVANNAQLVKADVWIILMKAGVGKSNKAYLLNNIINITVNQLRIGVSTTFITYHRTIFTQRF